MALGTPFLEWEGAVLRKEGLKVRKKDPQQLLYCTFEGSGQLSSQGFCDSYNMLNLRTSFSA